MGNHQAAPHAQEASYTQLAIDTVYNAYLNCFLREITGWEKIFQHPTQDETLAQYMESGSLGSRFITSF